MIDSDISLCFDKELKAKHEISLERVKIWVKFYESPTTTTEKKKKIVINKSANNEKGEKDFLRLRLLCRKISILTTRIPSVTQDFVPHSGTLWVAANYYFSGCRAFSRTQSGLKRISVWKDGNSRGLKACSNTWSEFLVKLFTVLDLVKVLQMKI